MPSEGSDGEDLHKKSDIFDTSKEKIKSSNPQKKDDDLLPDIGFKGGSQDGGALDEEQEQEQIAQEIEEQFQVLYDGDPELRKVLEKSDVSTFTVQEKY